MEKLYSCIETKEKPTPKLYNTLLVTYVSKEVAGSVSEIPWEVENCQNFCELLFLINPCY